MATKRDYNGPYTGEFLNRVAFPMGGIGAGMVCLEGTGALSHVSVRNKPDLFNEPMMFAAVFVKGAKNGARALEGPVPSWKAFGPAGAGNGGRQKTYGLPRFRKASFHARFPFGTVLLAQPGLPVRARIVGWSPFLPGNADDSSLPLAVLEYRLENVSKRPVEAVFSFHARNFMEMGAGPRSVGAADGGFVLRQDASPEAPHEQGAFSVVALDPDVKVNCAWFRGGWFDAITMTWKGIAEGRAPERPPLTEGAPSPGGSLYVPMRLKAGESREVRLLLNWYCPVTDIRVGKEVESACGAGSGCCAPPSPAASPARKETHVPWYAGRFKSIEEVIDYCRANIVRLREETARFTDCFYDTTLPPEVIEAVAANLTILKSPTCLRQTDGRLWAWEGCSDATGCCAGTCTHVWNYAQAIPHLFPALERGLRATEFGENQSEDGHQDFRASLPIRPTRRTRLAAADGQLGGIMKVYRDWRISGDTRWLRALWPKVRASMEYCIRAWDPEEQGALIEPHHNTYDIEFWGPDGMCGSFYAGALFAAARMADALGEDAGRYHGLYGKARQFLETELFDGEYFIQKILWRGLRAGDPTKAESLVKGQYSPEAVRLLEQEGPKYQYGSGCLADGVLGAWIARACGLGDVLDPEKVRSHLRAVRRHNLRKDLSNHVNPQRPTYAFGKEGGLLLCTWPKGGALSLPFVYSNEVWTGIEYHVASHLMMMGCVDEGLEIVRTARNRHDGRVRNPFNEYECGHWYARAMSSYGMLQGLSGARYDAVEKTLHLEPSVSGDFRSFLCAASGYGTVGVRDGKPFLEVRSGEMEVRQIKYRPADRNP